MGHTDINLQVTDLTDEPYFEGVTPTLTYTLKTVKSADGSRDPVPGSKLTTMVATVVSNETGFAIPNWTRRNILNLEGNSVDESGIGVWNMPASATAKGAPSADEIYFIELEFAYDAVGSGPAGAGKHRFIVKLLNWLG